MSAGSKWPFSFTRFGDSTIIFGLIGHTTAGLDGVAFNIVRWQIDLFLPAVRTLGTRPDVFVPFAPQKMRIILDCEHIEIMEKEN